MDSGSLLSWIFLAVLLLLAAWLAAAEVSVTSVSRIRLKLKQDSGDPRAKKALYNKDHFDEAISALLIATNIVHISAATLCTVLVTRLWGASWVALGTVVCTVVVFFAGEMLPKSLGKRYCESFALSTAAALYGLMHVLGPVSRLLTRVSLSFAKAFPAEEEVSVTEDELYDIVENMTDEGKLDSEQGELMHSALEFNDVTAEHVLTPRVDMEALDVNTAPEQVLAFLRRVRFNRIPVYEKTVDNIIGVLQTRRYIREYLAAGRPPALRELLDEPYFVHESAPVQELLEELNRRRLGLAVVTDNYGGTVGIITVEDILEELVGEIWDEDDVAHTESRELGENRWEIDADMDMEDLFETVGIEGPEDVDWDRKPVGEWVYEQFDLLPRQGDSFERYGLRVTIEAMERRRIRRLLVTRLAPPESGKEDSE